MVFHRNAFLEVIDLRIEGHCVNDDTVRIGFVYLDPEI